MADKNCGLITCCRYSYPPNSLSLCGPDAKKNLVYYSTSGKADLGTKEILRQFSTLYPYLAMIAYENSIPDPFDYRVVEAYWLGNSLLKRVPKRTYANFLKNTLGLKQKTNHKELHAILEKFDGSVLPDHSFHVLNIFRRTGHLPIPHTIQTMDACLINWGKVTQIMRGKIRIMTQMLAVANNKIYLEKNIERTVKQQGLKDNRITDLKTGDIISYHWGYFCQKLSLRQLNNLAYYTQLSIKSANLN